MPVCEPHEASNVLKQENEIGEEDTQKQTVSSSTSHSKTPSRYPHVAGAILYWIHPSTLKKVMQLQ